MLDGSGGIEKHTWHRSRGGCPCRRGGGRYNRILKPDSSRIVERFAVVNLQVAPVRTKTPQQADKMLNAAARLFGTQRFHEVRMEDIAAEAAVGKGTIYRYFSDKDELYL